MRVARRAYTDLEFPGGLFKSSWANVDQICKSNILYGAQQFSENRKMEKKSQNIYNAIINVDVSIFKKKQSTVIFIKGNYVILRKLIMCLFISRQTAGLG